MSGPGRPPCRGEFVSMPKGPRAVILEHTEGLRLARVAGPAEELCFVDYPVNGDWLTSPQCWLASSIRIPWFSFRRSAHKWTDRIDPAEEEPRAARPRYPR